MKINLEISRDQYLEVEKLALGVFSPLDQFMDRANFESVVEKMELTDGSVFTLPVVFAINADEKELCGNAQTLELSFNQKHVANLFVTSIYKIDKASVLQKIFGTSDTSHPGVSDFLECGEYFVSGKVELLEKVNFEFSKYELTPAETKAHFKKMGWKKVVGFQTRNIPHRAHEYLQKAALETVDGIFIQPLVGRKKAGDFTPEAVMNSYGALIADYYPENRVLLGVLSTKMRYAGPREAIFHAIIRRNYGCTHFIIGRDHAGVGGFYDKYAAHNLAEKFSERLGIELLTMSGPFHCNKCEDIVTDKTCPHGEDYTKDSVAISGTDVRALLSNKDVADDDISKNFLRPSVLRSLSNMNSDIFI